MPANPRQQAAQPSAAVLPKSANTYTNKDGTKFITIPKVDTSIDFPEPSPAMAQSDVTHTSPAAAAASPTVPVNRKKQKRREKQAARLVAAAAQAERAIAAAVPKEMQQQILNLEARFREHVVDDHYERHFEAVEQHEPYFSDDGDAFAAGYAMGAASGPQTAKKKKKKKKSTTAHGTPVMDTMSSELNYPQPASQQPAASKKKKRKGGKEKIWNTTSQEERERIKEFWLSLGEEERRSLVKVEKDAVLKKMKEQQKHSCSCTVCGRKRTAIEEELEVLYDAYYEELEQYANTQQGDGSTPMLPPPRRYGQIGGVPAPHRLPPSFTSQQPSRGKIIEQLADDEDDLDDGYSDEELDDEYSDDEPEDLPRSHERDFFTFGNSLTVQGTVSTECITLTKKKGGILTVADDLLKNDGKKFIEMMEQLAERRMAREEDARIQQAAHNNGYAHMNGSLPPHPHNHPPLDEDDLEDEDDEEDPYGSQEEDYDEEEMDTMTEEQRMEEGRRMFQIFAARMFEQRVLTAYKEKVAKERQQKLLEELEEESRADSQRKAKRAKDAQKKKDKLHKKKEALAEERARKEAEKAAEEAATKAAEAKRLEEQRQKNEEKRKKREAQKKAEEEERVRKEAEKQRRLQEQRERQAEQEKRQREAKEREKREREEQRQRERDVKDAKDKEARERKEKLERARHERAAKLRVEKEAELRRDELSTSGSPAVHPISQHKRPSLPTPASVPSSAHPPGFASPHVPVATPALPMAPTPMRARQASQQESISSGHHTPQGGERKSQTVSPSAQTSSQGSPAPNGKLPPFLHQPQATSPIHSAIKSPPGFPPPGPFSGVQPLGLNGFPPGMPMAPGFGSRMHHESMFPQGGMGQPFRPLSGPNGMPPYMGMNGMPVPQGRQFSSSQGPPGFPPMINGLSNVGQPFGQKENGGQSHSRQQSFEKPGFDSLLSSSQPISRPAPIGRPSSVVHGSRHDGSGHGVDVDDLSNHLGSSALLDDSDEPIMPTGGARRPSNAPGGMARPAFAPFGMEPTGFGGNHLGGFHTWGGLPNAFPGSVPVNTGYLSGSWGSHSTGFGSVGPTPQRMVQPRAVAVRLMLCRACRSLEGSTVDSFFDLEAVREQMDRMDPVREEPVLDAELLDICETEGNATNGGGYFDVRTVNARTLIRYEPDSPSSGRRVGAPGEIGSPVVGAGSLPSLPPRFAAPPGIPTPGGF